MRRYLLFVLSSVVAQFADAAASKDPVSTAPAADAQTKEVADFIEKLRRKIRDPGEATGIDGNPILISRRAVGWMGGARDFSVPYENRDLVAQLAPLLPTHLDALLQECASVSKEMRLLTDEIFIRSSLATIREHSDFGPADRAIAYGYLARVPMLLDVIVARKWVLEAEPHIAEAALKVEYHHDVYATLLVQLPSPASQKALLHLLLNRDPFTAAQCYFAVKKVRPEALKWDKIVAHAWQTAKKDRDYLHYYAPIAARHGHVDALVTMANIQRDSLTVEFFEISFADELQQLVPGEFKNAAARSKFIKQHAAQLVFDAEAEVYRLVTQDGAK